MSELHLAQVPQLPPAGCKANWSQPLSQPSRAFPRGSAEGGNQSSRDLLSRNEASLAAVLVLLCQFLQVSGKHRGEGQSEGCPDTIYKVILPQFAPSFADNPEVLSCALPAQGPAGFLPFLSRTTATPPLQQQEGELSQQERRWLRKKGEVYLQVAGSSDGSTWKGQGCAKRRKQVQQSETLNTSTTREGSWLCVTAV